MSKRIYPSGAEKRKKRKVEEEKNKDKVEQFLSTLVVVVVVEHQEMMEALQLEMIRQQLEMTLPQHLALEKMFLNNEWQDDWVTFFSQQRLQHQLNMVEESYGDKEARELWAKLQLKMPQFFKDTEVVPALLHGDLWGGNVAQCADGPVIFDPSSFYGHSEFELGIAGMFGGFNSAFYSAYHEKIPKAPGFAQRNQLYQLFNYLNHWNHFGDEYRRPSISVMKKLLN